jgi:hypothetical protein
MTEPRGGHIGFEQIGIGNVLRTSWLQVPLHQREYSWTDREVNDLFHDIGKAITDNAPEYFLGSIVTIPRDGAILEVVDGQQRLATTAILFAAIRDFLSGRDQDKVIVSDIAAILTAVDRSARELRSRLRLNVTDHSFFERLVTHGDAGVRPSARSHELIAQAVDLARTHVRKVTAAHNTANHGDVLNGWLTYLERKAIVALLKVPSEINAYRMFETLNDRGLRTSQSDLVKNYLFGQSAERINEAQVKWSAMRAILESFEDDDITINFLRQTLISIYGPIRESDVYDTIASKAKGASQAINFLALLESCAADYAAILNPQHEKWNAYPPSLRQALRATTIIRVRAMRPLMLSVARFFDPVETAKAFKLILSASVRLTIAGGAKSAARSGTVETALAEMAQAVTEKRITATAGILAAFKEIVPGDAQFEAAFAGATVSKVELARYYLRSLEMSAKGQADPCFLPNEDATAITLEHVLPKNPEGNWAAFTDDEAELAYRRLGNMVLLQAKSNSDLKSAAFSAKAAVYKDSPYVLTSQVSGEKTWTSERIETRQKALAKLATGTWPLSVA